MWWVCIVTRFYFLRRKLKKTDELLSGQQIHELILRPHRWWEGFFWLKEFCMLKTGLNNSEQHLWLETHQCVMLHISLFWILGWTSGGEKAALFLEFCLDLTYFKVWHSSARGCVQHWCFLVEIQMKLEKIEVGEDCVESNIRNLIPFH